MNGEIRLDQYLVKKGIFQSRNRAKTEIKSGSVRVDGHFITKPAFLVDGNHEPNIEIQQLLRYVSRAGEKLDYALKKFEIKVQDLIALDVGASTGGFTECLIRHGAKKVFAVDVGTDQLHQSLKMDPRIINIEHYNARNIKKDDFTPQPDFFVMDVSFISLKKIILKAIEVTKEKWGIVLCKPQFESNGENLKDGVIKDQRVIDDILDDIEDFLFTNGIIVKDIVQSPLKGQKGNTEYLFYIKKNNN